MKSVSVVILTLLNLSLFAQSDSTSHYYQTGKEAFLENKFRVAEIAYHKSLSFNNEHIPSLQGLYSSLLAQSRYPEAYAILLKIEPLTDGNDKFVVGELSRLSLDMRKWQDAIRYAEKAKQLNVEGNHSYTLSKAYYHLEDYGKSLQHADHAFRYDSSSAEIPYIAAQCFLEMSNYKRAAGCYEQVLARDSSKPQWMYEAGLVYYAMPDDKKAIYWIEKAGEKGYRKTNDYYENLANAYLNSKQFEKGTAILIELLAKKPQDQELLYNIADGYYRQGKFDQAIEYWDKILFIDKQNAQALYMIGLSYQKKGDVSKGQQLCDAAIKLDPSLGDLKKERRLR
ncbi:tetratricopeptide repeat protein [Gynurincola endophyticus]|jgi:tetratricopeptide (TPR) repeat protein|uniref:tetratricopeptide repeat protein n=1 Tax=Gynurincola endophyticus TaxID=2479004 RepID=UPI000F8E247E|nr:tetratricopeptide repeat protein [Gynurincola endophyticus]